MQLFGPKRVLAVDIGASQLKIGDSVHVREMKIPANIKVLNDPNATVLSVTAPIKEEVPAEAVEGAEKQEPEVIKEKKEVPGEGEAGVEGKKEK